MINQEFFDYQQYCIEFKEKLNINLATLQRIQHLDLTADEIPLHQGVMCRQGVMYRPVLHSGPFDSGSVPLQQVNQCSVYMTTV